MMHGDCSIRVNGLGFTPAQVAECVQRKGLLSFELELSASHLCGCSACASSPQAVLSLDEIRALFDQAIELGAQRCILVDTDTTPPSHLTQLIDDLGRRSVQVELFTTGQRIHSESANFLHDRNVAVVLNEDEPADVRILLQAGYGTPDGPRLAVRLPITRENIDDLPHRWREARSRGIEPWAQIMSAGDGIAEAVSPQRAKALFEELARIDREEFGHLWELPPSLTGRSCKRHLFAAHVTPCGTIFACVGVTIPLGSIRTESLQKIFDESEVLENIRAFDQKVKEPCRTCSKTADCYGCRGSAYQLTGDYLAGDQLCWKADGMRIPTLPITVKGLIPHGPSMRMVDRLVQVGERRARLEFLVTKDSPFVDADGRLDETAYIEMIAQSFAASHGFHMSPEELANHRGLLLGAKDLVVSGSAHVGDRLIVHLRKVARFGDFGVVEGSIFHDDGALVAAGEIKIWRPSDDAAKALHT